MKSLNVIALLSIEFTVVVIFFVATLSTKVSDPVNREINLLKHENDSIRVELENYKLLYELSDESEVEL